MIQKSKKIVFVVSEETLQTAVTFYIGHTWAEFIKILNDIKHETERVLEPQHETANGLGVEVKNKKNEICHVIWLKYFAWDIKRLGILAHEIIHTTGSIMDDKQIPIRRENDEVFAYLHEFYFKEALKKLNPKNKKK